MNDAQDAARYRWLLDNALEITFGTMSQGYSSYCVGKDPEEFNAAIDAAMTRWTLTDLGNAYRRAMTNKLNGEVKAGEKE